jgi:hypothetical protein
LVQPCVVHWHEYDSRPHVIIDGRLNDSGFLSSPLARRGWTLQERFLSPRMIHYGSEQIFWECRQQINVCETHPEGFPCDMPFFNGPAIFSIDSRPVDSSIEVTDHDYYYWLWHAILGAYVTRELSQPWGDKLVALAGIAQRVAMLLGDDYVVGFFRSHLPQSLLWHVPSGQEVPCSDLLAGRSTGRYRAPTWSWASMDGRLIQNGNPVVGDVLTQVVDVSVDLVDNTNPFGQVKYAQITLRGPLVRVPKQTIDTGSNFPTADQPSHKSWRPIYDDANTSKRDEVVAFALAITRRGSTIECLLLEPIEIAGQSKYTRLAIMEPN